MGFDVSGLRRTLLKRGVEEESLQPVILLTLYSEVSLHALGPFAAEALRKYLEMIPKGVLRSTSLDSGSTGKLTSRRLSRHLRRLDQPPHNEQREEIIYSSGEFGPPGDYGIFFILDDLSDRPFSEWANLLEFVFPSGAQDSCEETLGLATELASAVPFSSGTCGFGFSHWEADAFARDQIYELLPRYFGFSHSSSRGRETVKGLVPCPSWLTFLGGEAMEALGGKAALAEHAPDATAEALRDGYVIRAAKHPPVGDINQGAPDLGSLPGVARFLKPKRTNPPILEGAEITMEVNTWLSRFDDLDNRPWDNG